MKNKELPKHDIIIKNGFRHFDPDIISAKSSLYYIFPVPHPNAVGAIDDRRNGVVFIKFNDTNRANVKVIARNFSKEIFNHNFTYSFSTNFSDDLIVYSKTRVVVVVNVKTGEAFHAGFGLSSDFYIRGIRFLDPQNNLLAIVVSDDLNHDILTDSLHIARLEGRRLIDLGVVIPEFARGGTYDWIYPPTGEWLIHDRILILYDTLSSKNMLAFDGLTETRHPFVEVFNNNKNKIRVESPGRKFPIKMLRDFAIHPQLPFGIVAGSDNEEPDYRLPYEVRKIFYDTILIHPLHILRWNTDDPDEQFTTISLKLLPLVPLFEGVKHLAFAYPSFSPDGKWFVLGCFQDNLFDEVHYIAIPVDPENPEFLNINEVIVLGYVHLMTSMSWSTDPVALVVSDGGVLFKWNLGELDQARTIIVPNPDENKKETNTKKTSFFEKIKLKLLRSK